MVLYKTVKKSYPIQNNQIALYSFSNSKMLPNRCQSAMLQAEKCGITPFLRSCFYMYPLAVPGISFAFARTFRPLRNKRLAASASGSASAFIPTPQISPDTEQICLGDLLCGISVIHFALYYTAH